ncbi:Hypp3428 [Branchiostoma lanceolatum]|uniref:Hypp3428 protein n=1 Tax=Branchiostoma lanceolatum TaxID=7740 RepID=A0A8K0A109_BRALA|nr:Hypp3428 [Branchiostoma lanceolatum]
MSFEFLYHNRLKNAPKVKDESANRQIRLSENSYKRGGERVRRASEKEDEKDVQDGGSSVFSDDNEADLELPPEVVRYETLSKSSIRRMQELREEIEQGKRYRRENEPDRKKQQNPLEWEKVKGKKGFRRSGSMESEDSVATNSDDLKDFATVRRQLEQNFQRSQSVETLKGKENGPSPVRSVSFDPNVDVRKIPRDDYPSNKNDYHDMVEDLKSVGTKTLVIEPEKRVISTKQQPRADGGIVVSESPRSSPGRKPVPPSHGSYTITTQRPQAPTVLSPPTSPRRTTEPQQYSLADSGPRFQTNNARPAENSSGAGGSWRLVQNGVQAETGEAIPQGARIEYGPDGRMWVYARQEHVQWTTVHLTDSNSHPAPVSPRHHANDHRPPSSTSHVSVLNTDSVPHLTIQQNDTDHDSVTITNNGNIKGRDGKTVIQSAQNRAAGARAGVSLSGSTRDGHTDTPSHFQNGHVAKTDFTEEKSINFQSETDSSDPYRGYFDQGAFDRDDSLSSSYTSGYRNDVELERVRQGMEMSMDFVDESGGRSRKIPSDDFVGW